VTGFAVKGAQIPDLFGCGSLLATMSPTSKTGLGSGGYRNGVEIRTLVTKLKARHAAYGSEGGDVVRVPEEWIIVAVVGHPGTKVEGLSQGRKVERTCFYPPVIFRCEGTLPGGGRG
jgi:hypothetical protein